MSKLIELGKVSRETRTNTLVCNSSAVNDGTTQVKVCEDDTEELCVFPTKTGFSSRAKCINP